MEKTAVILTVLGGIFLIALIAEIIGRRIRIPRVTLLLLFGFVIGPSVLHLLPIVFKSWFPIISKIALAMIGFLLGGKLTLVSLHNYGKFVLWISISEVILTTILVFIGLIIIGVPAYIALLAASIASATAPAATVDVIREAKAKGMFTDTLQGIVAVDDAWALIVFSILLVFAKTLVTHSYDFSLLIFSSWEIGGAIILGIIIGVPAAYLTGRIHDGEPTLIEALGLVFLCCGLALWLKVSFLLACMTLGFVITNLAKHHNRPFHAVEGIEWPFMILFFIFAGASLHLGALKASGIIGAVYILFRIIGRLFGAWLGGIISKANKNICYWMGLALMPQAGVALGMALIAIQVFPKLSNSLLPIILGATVVFELIGPVGTKYALKKVKEVPNSS